MKFKGMFFTGKSHEKRLDDLVLMMMFILFLNVITGRKHSSIKCVVLVCSDVQKRTIGYLTLKWVLLYP